MVARKPSTAPLVYVNGAAAYENHITGFPHKVLTWGRPLTWVHQDCVQDTSASAEKRDRFDKRNQLCYSVAEAGSFEWSIAFAPNLDGTQTKRPVHCAFCNALHNWCVFYRRASDQTYLGHSGCDCFSSVVQNLKLPNADAVLKAAKQEKSRSERFRRTMEKVNDFKRDFPGLYENREWMNSPANPYQPLWNHAMRQLDRAEGVDEKFFEGCVNGRWDYRTRFSTNRDARRLPDYLKYASRTATASGFDTFKRESVDMALKEGAGTFCRNARSQYPSQNRAQSAPAAQAPQSFPIPSLPPTVSQVQADGQFLVDNGYSWSFLAKNAASGKTMTLNAAAWVHKEAQAVRDRKAQQRDKVKELVEGKSPLSATIPISEGIQVEDGF